jgi:hypothetical protein
MGPVERLAPPAELDDGPEAAVFRQTVAAAPASHFLPEGLPLSCAYAPLCRA